MDSMALTYSLFDPIMTVMRPVVAFVTGAAAGIVENLTGRSYVQTKDAAPDLSCPVDGCCDGVDCEPEEHAEHHTFIEKLSAGMAFAFNDLMGDIAKWFLLGIVLAGAISCLVPESFFEAGMSSGIVAYLGMLLVSLPMYVCATMSTPIAAALVLKGLSPGAALVFLVAGPATNVATVTMVWGILGKRTLAIYLVSIIVCTIAFAYMTDFIYTGFGISAKASAGASAGELFPWWLEWAAAVVLAVLCLRTIRQRWVRPARARETEAAAAPDDCCAADAESSACCGEVESAEDT